RGVVDWVTDRAVFLADYSLFPAGGDRYRGDGDWAVADAGGGTLGDGGQRQGRRLGINRKYWPGGFHTCGYFVAEQGGFPGVKTVIGAAGDGCRLCGGRVGG